MTRHPTFQIILLAGALALGGCGNSTDQAGAGAAPDAEDANAAAPVEATPENLTASAQPGQAADGEGVAAIIPLQRGEPSGKSDFFAISNARYSYGAVGEFIVADLSFGGGCKEHKFAAYWDGSWMKSNPPGVGIVLEHDANGDTCKAQVTKTVQVDIRSLTETQRGFWVTIGGAGTKQIRVTVPEKPMG